MDESDREILAELAEDPEGVRGALSEADLRQLDFLLGLFAAWNGEEHDRGVGRAVADHLRQALPDRWPQITGRRFSPGTRSTGSGPWQPGPSSPSLGRQPATDPGNDVAALFRAVTDRLLGAPSVTPDELRTYFGQDPDHPHLIRLARPGEPPRLPAFQFDADGRPLPVVLEINELLGSAADPWGVADWWLGPNLWLDLPPALLLGTCPDSQLLAAASTVGEEI